MMTMREDRPDHLPKLGSEPYDMWGSLVGRTSQAAASAIAVLSYFWAVEGSCSPSARSTWHGSGEHYLAARWFRKHQPH